MIADLVAASIAQGAPMIGVVLAIAVVAALIYLVRGRRRADRDEGSDRSLEASRRSPDE
jgi:hypothetical protein